MLNSPINIEGIWLVDGKSLNEPCILALMANGRAVQFPTSVSKPLISQTMRLWYSDYDGRRIRFRPSPTSTGWWRRVDVSAQGWVMTAEAQGHQSCFQCTHLPSHLLPDWYHDLLAINLEKMKTSEDDNA